MNKELLKAAYYATLTVGSIIIIKRKERRRKSELEKVRAEAFLAGVLIGIELQEAVVEEVIR